MCAYWPSACSVGQERRLAQQRIRLYSSFTVHLTTDSHAESNIFLFEPNFISQVVDLVHPDKNVPIGIKAVALLTLDTVSRIKNKVGEVTSALSVSVNHGTLMSILRKLSADLQTETSGSSAEHSSRFMTMLTDVDDIGDITTEYIDALFGFLMLLQSTGYAGNMLLGAGIIPLLIELAKDNGTPRAASADALLAANRAVTFLDNFTYSFSSASAPFSAAGGLTVFVDRAHKLVKSGVSISEARVNAGEMELQGLSSEQDQEMLSFPEMTLLKSLFRCLQRLMGSGGSAEGVRNLIDSSLVESCKLVMQHRKVFGPQNLALAINIMLTFVHNEPTSLTVLQESKLPDAFYDAVSGDIEPSLDVLSAIPTAIGALCLNEAGLNHFIEHRLPLITHFFSIFTSEKHARVLNDRENAVVIGANFDELVRHHPSLKTPVFESITQLLKNLYAKGATWQTENPEGYRLQQVEPQSQAASSEPGLLSTQDQSQPAGQTGDSAMGEASSTPAPPAVTAAPEDKDSKKDDNQMLTYVTIVGRVSQRMSTIVCLASQS